MVDSVLALVAIEAVGAVAMERCGIAGGDIRSDAGGLQSSRGALIASTTIDALVDRSAPNNTGVRGILIASGTSPSDIASALVGTRKVLAHAVNARVGAECTLIKIEARATGTTNITKGAVARGQRGGSVDGVINAITGRDTLLAGLEVADGAAVNDRASGTAVAGRAVALSNEAAILGNVAARGSRVDTGARIGLAWRGDFAGGTTPGTTKRRRAVAGDGSASDRGSNAGTTRDARVVGLVGSINSRTAGRLELVAASTGKASVASADPVVLSQRESSRG